jgi:hypothetical protein
MLPLCERDGGLSRVRMDYARARVAFVVIAGVRRCLRCHCGLDPQSSPALSGATDAQPASGDQHGVEQRAARSHEVDHVRDRLHDRVEHHAVRHHRGVRRRGDVGDQHREHLLRGGRVAGVERRGMRFDELTQVVQLRRVERLERVDHGAVED